MGKGDDVMALQFQAGRSCHGCHAFTPTIRISISLAPGTCQALLIRFCLPWLSDGPPSHLRYPLFVLTATSLGFDLGAMYVGDTEWLASTRQLRNVFDSCQGFCGQQLLESPDSNRPSNPSTC